MSKCILWPKAVNADGYGQVWLEGKVQRVHRVEYQKHFGPIPEGLCVRHTCDNPRCYNIEHLILGTHKENMKDRDTRNPQYHAKGERVGGSKLKEEDVRKLRQLVAEGLLTKVAIAKMFNIHSSHVQKIYERRSWKHVL